MATPPSSVRRFFNFVRMHITPRYFLILLALLFVAIIIVTVSRFYTAQKPQTQPIIPTTTFTAQEQVAADPVEEVLETITAQELLFLHDVVIIDLRLRDDFTEAHIRGSIHLDDFIIGSQGTRNIVLLSDASVDAKSLRSIYATLTQQSIVYVYNDGLRPYQEGGGIIIRTNDATDFNDLSKVTFVEPRDLYTRMEKKDDVIILDVRRAGNFADSHIANALSIPFAELEYRYRELLSLSKDLYVYGADETQSFEAGALLFDLGIFHAQTINGGFAAWQEFGYPVVQ